MSTQFVHPQPANSGHSLDRFLREPEVLRLVGVSPMTLYRWEKTDRFPARYRIGPNSVAWKESDVLQWLATRDVATTSSSKKEAM